MEGKQIENPSIQKDSTADLARSLCAERLLLSVESRKQLFVNSVILNNSRSLAVCRIIPNEWVEMMSKELIGLSSNEVGDCSKKFPNL